jgi:hypothetical protein
MLGGSNEGGATRRRTTRPTSHGRQRLPLPCRIMTSEPFRSTAIPIRHQRMKPPRCRQFLQVGEQDATLPR